MGLQTNGLSLEIVGRERMHHRLGEVGRQHHGRSAMAEHLDDRVRKLLHE